MEQQNKNPRKLKRITYDETAIGNKKLYPCIVYITEKMNEIEPKTAKYLAAMFSEYNTIISNITVTAFNRYMPVPQRIMTLNLYKNEFLRRVEELKIRGTVDQGLYNRLRSFVIGKCNEEIRTRYNKKK